ncbi:hypothetical protein AMTRI_Chr01g107490 [Amborella trichopoda]
MHPRRAIPWRTPRCPRGIPRGCSQRRQPVGLHPTSGLGTHLGSDQAYCVGVPSGSARTPSRRPLPRRTPRCPPGKLRGCVLIGRPVRLRGTVCLCAHRGALNPYCNVVPYLGRFVVPPCIVPRQTAYCSPRILHVCASPRLTCGPSTHFA